MDFRRLRNWSRRIGRRGENAAVDLLIDKNIQILARNCRIAPHCGEVDVIALDGETLVFVEVKTRYLKGSPRENLSEEQKKRIRRAAGTYLSILEAPGFKIRFDLIEVIAGRFGSIRSIHHHQNAFGRKG